MGNNSTYTYTDTAEQYITFGSPGEWFLGSSVVINNNENNKMKQEKLTKYTIVFLETVVREHKYEMLAESKEDAIKKISDGGISSDVYTVSIERVIKE